MITADVAVVGGGPAGSAAATLLARRGRSVVLVDKARFPRDKCCGDGLTAGALRRLEALGLRPDAVPSWFVVEDVWVRPPSGRTVRFPLPRGERTGTYAAIARRVDLDAALLDLARAAGAKVHDGHALLGATWEDGADHVRLDVDGIGPVAARYVVGADGMWSPLRKALGAADEDGYLGEWHAFRQYFRNVGPAASSQLWVWFDEDLLPGYAWSFPLPGGRANVGFGIRRQAGAPTRAMAEQWQDVLGRTHVRAVLGDQAEPESPHKAWPIPARVDRSALSAAGGRVLFVGDAARATDPMTGEGIGQALETAELAVEAIERGGPFAPHVAAAHYARTVGAGLAADHRLAASLSSTLSSRRGVEWAVRIAGATPWTRRNFARWLFEDYPRAILATAARWHPRMFSAPGAYRR